MIRSLVVNLFGYLSTGALKVLVTSFKNVFLYIESEEAQPIIHYFRKE
jgi:hypothetical protein